MFLSISYYKYISPTVIDFADINNTFELILNEIKPFKNGN